MANSMTLRVGATYLDRTGCRWRVKWRDGDLFLAQAVDIDGKPRKEVPHSYPWQWFHRDGHWTVDKPRSQADKAMCRVDLVTLAASV